MVKLEIKLDLEWDSAFHTTGNRWRWGADKALVQRYDGAYVLPATSLKGALRDQAERLLRDQVCIAPDSKQMCRDVENLCLVCRVFGNPRRPSPLRFTDAVLDQKPETTQIRAGVAISRRRRAAVPHHLYFLETTTATSKAKTTIEGFFSSQEEAKKAAALVVLATRMLPALGAGRTRGLGWLKTINAECIIDNQPLPEAELKHYWDQWLGGTQ